ncbi:MAG: DUF2382 domain-containing protein [Leptolyngbya sp. BL-A-14]
MTSSNSSNNPNRSRFVESAPLESSAPLEASAPLDFREEEIHVVTSTERPVVVPPSSVSPPQVHEPMIEPDRNIPPAPSVEPLPVIDNRNRQEELALRQLRSTAPPKIVEEEVIPLLEERLVVDRKRRKVGEVVVRKEIETQMIEVPVRREKLIVEQIGAETKQLATIDLGQTELDVEPTEYAASAQDISGEFTSIRAAIQFLETMASTQPDLDNQSIKVKILVENSERKQLYKQHLDLPSNLDLPDHNG